MRFIIIISVAILAKCINNEMFLKLFEDGALGLLIVVLLALAMDLVEFAKNIDL